MAFLARCVVNPMDRKFYLYSDEGDEKVVDCETMEQFFSVLEVVRKDCPKDMLSYSDPLVTS